MLRMQTASLPPVLGSAGVLALIGRGDGSGLTRSERFASQQGSASCFRAVHPKATAGDGGRCMTCCFGGLRQSPRLG